MEKHEKHINVIGAGPGGLTAAMLLAGRGFQVTVFREGAAVGGRNGAHHAKRLHVRHRPDLPDG